MRFWGCGAATLSLTGLLLAGCESDTDESGFASVTITKEKEEVVAGNLCAITGHATNGGISRARVRITWEGKDSGGNVKGTSSADFEVAPFSDFEFSNSKLNNQGQPSSSVFSNNLSCAAIDNIDRKHLDVEAI